MRVFAYVRVSKEREGMVSPEIQTDAIAHYCGSRGWQVLETFTDIDFSGKLPPEKRPGLQSLLSRAGECDMVVVYRVDRLSREPSDYYAILAVLREMGVGIDAAAQPHDATPEGDLLWDLSAILARYESLKLGARLKDMHKRLAASGRWHGGMVPYGWRRMKDENGVRLELDPVEAPVRVWMHESYHTGWSCLRIAKDLNQRHILTRKGSTWTDGQIYNMLGSVYQVGARRSGDDLVSGGNVEPLLDDETFERTLALMRVRNTRRGRIGAHAIPACLCRCGNCGGVLVAGAQDKEKGSGGAYECLRRRRGLCNQGVSVRYHILEPYVLRRLFAHIKGARSMRPAKPVPDIAPLMADLDRIREALGKLALMRAEGTIDEAEFASARSLQRQRQAKLEERIERAGDLVESDARGRLLDAMWTDLGALTVATWDALSIQARRDILSLVIERITVDPASSSRAPVERRVHIRWR